MIALYPLLLTATLHAKPWGGRALADYMHKPLPTDEPYGEAWELHDTSIVANGPHNGRTLGDLLREYGEALVGAGNDPAEGFPLLAKILDANDWLSIQDHPNDKQARELEGEPRGKNEAWYMLGAEAGARLVIGVQPGLSREDIAAAIVHNSLEDKVVYANVSEGDVMYMAAGSVHALGPGLLVYEIQQSSDTTYRLYDWGRMGLDGKPRALHIEKGLKVANLETLPEIKHTRHETGKQVEIVRSPYFYTDLYQLNAINGQNVDLDTGGRRFHSLTCIDGSAMVHAGEYEVAFTTGQTVLIPAALGAYTLHGEDTRVLLSAQNP
ncbi:MAG: type I phosphomannose isomerase catalytic subunit [Chloroflexota bacterium]|nr:type I phosphomannose isomerase catalytic subunit [Chloroflexota bacterium]